MYQTKYSKLAVIPTVSKVKAIDTIEMQLLQAMGEAPLNYESSNPNDFQQQSRSNKQKQESSTNQSKKLRYAKQEKLNLANYTKKRQTEKSNQHQSFHDKVSSIVDNKNYLRHPNGSETSRRSQKYSSSRELALYTRQDAIQEQEKFLKEIEYKAIMLKKKQRKERDMIRQFKKAKIGEVGLNQIVERSQCSFSEASNKEMQDKNQETSANMTQQSYMPSKQQQVKVLSLQLQKIIKRSQMDKKNYQDTVKQFQNRQKQLLLKLQHYQQNLSQRDKQINSELLIKIENLNKELKKTKEQLSKMNLSIQQKQKNLSLTQQYLIHAEQHISRVETKYNEVNKELTEKNLAYDFLWMQLQEQKISINNLQKQLNQYKNIKLQKKNSTSLSPQKQNSEDYQISNIQSNSHNLKNQYKRPTLTSSIIKQIQIQIIGGEANINKDESPRNIRLSQMLDQWKEKPIQQICSKKRINIMLQPDVSDAFSQSEYNDQIQDLVSNKNSNTSKMESSVGAFSEYSRIKSTQSEMNRRQVQKAYKNKMKNNKLMAKMNKLKNK